MVFRSQMTLPKSIYAWAQYSSKKNLRVDPGGLKNPKHKKCEKTTLEKNPLKKRERISDHPCQTNSQTHQVLSEALISLMLSRPSPLLSKARNLSQRSLGLERRSTGNQWKPMVFYAVLPTQPGRVSSNLSFQLGRSFAEKNPATHWPVLLLNHPEAFNLTWTQRILPPKMGHLPNIQWDMAQKFRAPLRDDKKHVGLLNYTHLAAGCKWPVELSNCLRRFSILSSLSCVLGKIEIPENCSWRVRPFPYWKGWILSSHKSPKRAGRTEPKSKLRRSIFQNK